MLREPQDNMSRVGCLRDGVDARDQPGHDGLGAREF
jgi:hypothetical protein